MTRLNTIRMIAERTFPEQIAIEGEPRHYVEPLKQPHRITRSRWSLASRLHGCSTELSLLEGHYLRVHSVRSRGQGRKYQFDLRYMNPRPVRVHHIAWAWLFACVASFAVAAWALAATWFDSASLRAVVIGVVTTCAGFIALFFFLRRTTESLTFRSEHGLVTLIEVTGGIGSTRKGKPFFVELIKGINAAKAERSQAKEHFLCDEMREHHRLRELGVLSEREYEQSKARILAQH
jgi:hypothetical protein